MERNSESVQIDFHYNKYEGFNDGYLEAQHDTQSQVGKKELELGGLTGQIDDLFGKRRFFIDQAEIGFFAFERKMLLQQGCPYILPFNVLHIDGGERVYYDFTGYLPLKDYIERMKQQTLIRGFYRYVEDSLTLVLNLLQSLRGAENFLLPTTRIPIIPETIFVNLTTREIAYVFIPSLCNKDTLQSNILKIIDCIETAYEIEAVSDHLNLLRDRIKDHNPGLDGLIRIAGIIKRESGYIEWSDHVLRHEEPSNTIEQIPIEKNQPLKSEQHEEPWFLKNKKAVIIIHVILIFVLALVFLANLFDSADFYGFCAITLGVDLWLMKSFYSAGKKN